MSYVYKTVEVGNLVLRVEFDHDAQSPREWDGNLGNMICWHRRHSLGDTHNYDSPSDFKQEINERNAVILPLYLYDHSGLTMNTTGFSCRWDSGQVGYIYALKEDIKREYGVKKVGKKLKEMIQRRLASEVGIYDQYIQGNTFGFILKEENGEEVDSSWGYIGHDFNSNGMMEVLPEEFREIVAQF